MFTDRLSHLLILNHLAERLGDFFCTGSLGASELVRILNSQKGFAKGVIPDMVHMKVTSWS